VAVFRSEKDCQPPPGGTRHQAARQQPPRDGLRRPRPLSGRKLWKSRSVPGTGRGSTREAKRVEGELLAAVAAGRHQDTHGVKVAELVDRWLEWRQAIKPMSPGTAANYRRYIELKIKPR
jgi:hypothetical protein